MTVKEVAELPSMQRVAGYIARSAKLAELGAKLRANGREDETWTIEEEAEWDALCDEIDPWWYAMTEEEYQKVKEIDLFLAKLCRGEDV